jgi:hypothetical protein
MLGSMDVWRRDKRRLRQAECSLRQSRSSDLKNGFSPLPFTVADCLLLVTHVAYRG